MLTLTAFGIEAMLTFLLAPLVGYIERWIGRIAAVLIVVAMLFKPPIYEYLRFDTVEVAPVTLRSGEYAA